MCNLCYKKKTNRDNIDTRYILGFIKGSGFFKGGTVEEKRL